MSKLPVASAFGSTDVVEMQPLPSPSSIHKYSSAAPVEHVLGEETNAIWLFVPQSAGTAYLLAYEGAAADADPDASWPIPTGVWPFAVTPGATITLTGVGGTFDYRVQEARL